MSANPEQITQQSEHLVQMRSNKAAKNGKDTILPFERRIAELEDRLLQTESDDERDGIAKELERERTVAFSNLSPWERVQLARHNQRPRMLDYTARIFDDLIELHGDRAEGDDPAVVGGLAQFHGRTVVVVGNQKGASTEERVDRNFGMAHPSGYRKAMRMFDLAERFNYPVISFVDTPAAHPGVDAERGGQGFAIAASIMKCLNLNVPIMTAVIGEGGSGGALALAAGDRIVMFEHAIYVICPPERCAEILWRDAEQKELAASNLRLTAQELHKFGIIDAVLPEPNGGSHRSPDAAAQVLSEEIESFIKGCDEGRWSREARQERFRNMGVWTERVVAGVEELAQREAAD